MAKRLQLTGAGGLLWWRIKDSPLADSDTGRQLRDTYRAQTLDAGWREAKLVTALGILREAGTEPILAKGWALGRYYPKKGVRPYGDLDLFVAPSDFATAESALAPHREDSLFVDLHSGPRGYRGSWDSIVERSSEVDLDGCAVRVFGPEDHLGLVCSHLLFHGAWRPLWLCDVAVLVEAAGSDFDWDYLLSLPGRQVEDTRVSVRLAHEVLGADISDTPWSASPHGNPKWIPEAALAAWSHEHYSTTTSFALTHGGPRALLKSARQRWPNPIEVTSRWNVPYGSFPRFPIQLLDAGTRAAKAVVGAPTLLSRRGAARGDPNES